MTEPPKIDPGDSVRPDATSRGEATYRRILDRAVARFDRDGTAGVVVTAIAREAGVSVGAVYHHFSGRSGLVAAARAEQFRRTTEGDIGEVERAVHTARDGAEFLALNRELVRRNRLPERAAARRERLAALVAAGEDPETALLVTVAQRRLTDSLAAAAERASERGWFDPAVDPRAWAVLMQGLLLGAVVADLDPDLNELAWVELVERVQDLALRT
ncbi:MAG: TetR/AcrR family transcriptional regulator [Microthrixaceae bacterium]